MRPPAPERAFAGCHWEAAEEDPKRWRAVERPELARPCRQLHAKRGGAGGKGYERETCKKPSVGACNRSPGRSNWWHYCAAHLFGRWVEDTPDGPKVFTWRLVDDVPA